MKPNGFFFVLFFLYLKTCDSITCFKISSINARANACMLNRWKSQLSHCSPCVHLILISILLLAPITPMFCSFIFLFVCMCIIFLCTWVEFWFDITLKKEHTNIYRYYQNVWNSKFGYCVPMSLPLVSSQSRKDLINIVTSYLLAIHSLNRVVLRRTSPECYFFSCFQPNTSCIVVPT